MDGEPDCTQACSDTETFFGSLETFYNCAALSSISYWTQTSVKYFISDEAERNASAIMGSGSLDDFDRGTTLDLFVSCAREACNEDGLSVPCGDSVRNIFTGDPSEGDIFDAIGNFCPSINAEIDPDIFGPGVSLGDTPV